MSIYSIFFYSILQSDLKQGAEKTQVEPDVGEAVPVQSNVTLYTHCIKKTLYTVQYTIYCVYHLARF